MKFALEDQTPTPKDAGMWSLSLAISHYQSPAHKLEYAAKPKDFTSSSGIHSSPSDKKKKKKPHSAPNLSQCGCSSWDSLASLCSATPWTGTCLNHAWADSSMRRSCTKHVPTGILLIARNEPRQFANLPQRYHHFPRSAAGQEAKGPNSSSVCYLKRPRFIHLFS